MAKINYATLTAELAGSHPVTGAYDADAQTAADELNAVNITQIKANLTGAEIWASTDATEYAALTADQKAQWLAFCGITDHDPSVGGLAQLFVVDLYGGASATVGNLGSLRGDNVSRASQLNLGVSVITISHVKAARGEA